MNKALIMGITGGFGGHVAQALLKNGWQIKALMRTPEKLPARFTGTEVIKGDAANHRDVENAAEDVDVIIYGVNPANYAWEGVVGPLLENVASVAEAHKLTIVFPGNVYNYNPAEGPDFSETMAQHPVTSKGRMRVDLENRLKQAAEHGAQVIILRMGDFIGRDAGSTWLGQMIKADRQGYILKTTGPHEIKHSWANLPDAASVVAMLLEKRKNLAQFSLFNFKGYQISFEELARAIEQASGKNIKLTSFPWFVFRLFAPFSHLFKSLIEMRYLWNQPVNLKQEKLEKVLNGNVPETPLTKALTDTGLIND